MSQLPSIHPTPAGRVVRVHEDRGSSTTNMEAAAASRQPNPLDILKGLTTTTALSPETRRKLTAVLRSAERECGSGISKSGGNDVAVGGPHQLSSPDRCGSPTSQSSSCRQRLTPLNPEMEAPGVRPWLIAEHSDHAPQARHMQEECVPASEWVRASNYDVSELPFRSRLAAGTASCAPDSSRRPSSALQDPQETFDKLNRALTYTMRYVEEVTELDFDITAVKEYDGSRMEDKERLFLSVCCSSIANFALCTTLSVDLRKLAHFLADLYKYYSAVNPYHNAIHAADSLQMASLFFRDPALNFLFTDEEILLCFLGVLALDVSHPGVSTTTLAELNHPLVMVYGDVTTKEQSSLLVFMHQLFLDENFFLNFDAPSHVTVRSRSLLREALYDIVLPSATRTRPFLSSELARIAAQRAVRLPDVNRLLCAILVLCDGAFALRSSLLALTWAAWWCDELEREEEERQGQFLRRLFPNRHLRDGQTAAQWAADYCDVVVGAIAEAARALVPTDLYDNLERNRDIATLRPPPTTSAASASGSVSASPSPTTTTEPRTPAPFVSSTSEEDAKRGMAVSAWTDTTSDIMDILKKTAAHANSLDRKASRGAILNASPSRASTGLSREWRAAGASSLNNATGNSHNAAGHSNSNNSSSNNNCGGGGGGNANDGRRGSNSAAFGVSVVSLEDDEALPAAAAAHPSRSEHYFSFLRLYDEFEKEGRSANDFAGQLVFLALQLDPSYIATAARKEFGDDSNAATCVDMAAYIRATEEAPATAEAIATTRVASAVFFAATDEPKGTDSFILYLMEMYDKRAEAAADVDGVAATAVAAADAGATDVEGDSWADNDSTDTSPPAEEPSLSRWSSTGDAQRQGSAIRDFASSHAKPRRQTPPPPQRDSPIRMPVSTDTSMVRAALAAHPLVSSGATSPSPNPPAAARR